MEEMWRFFGSSWGSWFKRVVWKGGERGMKEGKVLIK